MVGTDLTSVAEKELKDESEDAETSLALSPSQAYRTREEPRASVLLLRGSRLLPE